MTSQRDRPVPLAIHGFAHGSVFSNGSGYFASVRTRPIVAQPVPQWIVTTLRWAGLLRLVAFQEPSLSWVLRR